MKRATMAMAALALLVGGIGEVKAAPLLGVDYTSVGSTFGTSYWNLGYEFKANTNLTVVALGNADVTGRGWSQPQQVGLWTSTGTLLASTYVSNSDALVGVTNQWRFNSITPVSLIAGQSYIVGGQGGAGYSFYDNGFSVDSNITYVRDRWTYNGGTSNNPLVFPTYSSGVSQANGGAFFGGNVEFGTASPASAVPEPSTFAIFGMMLALGAGCFFMQRRRVVVPASVA